MKVHMHWLHSEGAKHFTNRPYQHTNVAFSVCIGFLMRDFNVHTAPVSTDVIDEKKNVWTV